jgi:hypothetical protein
MPKLICQVKMLSAHSFSKVVVYVRATTMGEISLFPGIKILTKIDPRIVIIYFVRINTFPTPQQITDLRISPIEIQTIMINITIFSDKQITGLIKN